MLNKFKLALSLAQLSPSLYLSYYCSNFDLTLNNNNNNRNYSNNYKNKNKNNKSKTTTKTHTKTKTTTNLSYQWPYLDQVLKVGFWINTKNNNNNNNNHNNNKTFLGCESIEHNLVCQLFATKKSILPFWISLPLCYFAYNHQFTNVRGCPFQILVQW